MDGLENSFKSSNNSQMKSWISMSSAKRQKSELVAVTVQNPSKHLKSKDKFDPINKSDWIDVKHKSGDGFCVVS